MIRCPHCQVENESEARVCSACGEMIASAGTEAELPQWLKQLKPEAPQSARSAGTDTLVATRPAPTVDTATTVPGPKARPAPTQERRETTAMKSADKSAPAGGNSETAALIGEDDLPSWLRAFSDPETKDKVATSDDQSWMVGNEADTAAANNIAENLAQSWQARTPARPTSVQRPAATTAFGQSAEVVAKPERVIAAPAAATPPPVASAPAADARQPATAITRPGASKSGRASLPNEQPTGRNLQRIATITFAAALIIFLIVVGIFIIAPALRG